MAMPITPTPALKGSEANRFFKVISKGLEKPTSLTPTPKLERARKIITDNAAARKK
ncbi:MAG: hypothetical protein U9P37_03875 [Pseudomonadota bacterium]|nr:hypothetical protein [Pseudomonadota bacterium]MEA3428508.1 hypothetical protein [Thermodesulfobacteriota bacterium]